MAVAQEIISDSQKLKAALSVRGQDHLFDQIRGLDPQEGQRLLQRVLDIDWDLVNLPAAPIDFSRVGPSSVLPLETRVVTDARYQSLCDAGLAAYERGEVAALLVAGGQGTRLGFDGPKGCFPAGPVSGKSLYQLLTEKVVAAQIRFGKPMPLLVMTSEHTHADSEQYFSENKNFGLAADTLRFFMQGTAPTINAQGQVLLASPSTLLENPDGHGGCLKAIKNSGDLDRLRSEGFKYIVYIQVDNPLAVVFDPLLVGLMVKEGAEMATKVVKKSGPDERVGNLCSLEGRDLIVEYIELSPDQRVQKGNDGELLFRWGNTAMHGFSVEFLSRMATDSTTLRYHRSEKDVQAFQDGSIVTTKGRKNELFIFDLIQRTDLHTGLEVARLDEFAPIKNEKGVDSPASSAKITSDLYRRWLQSVGGSDAVGVDEMVEISPLFASSFEEFRQKWDGKVRRVETGVLID